MSTSTIDWLTPAARMPWPVQAPFRMRPNLEKLDAASPALLIRDELFDVYQRERGKVIAAHGDRAAVGDTSASVFEAIRLLAASDRPVGAAPPRPTDIGATSGRGGAAPTTSDNVVFSLQEDFVILKVTDGSLRAEYLSVCFPSRWDPREKLGLDFMAIHQPVADNQMLQAAGPNLMAMAFMKQPMLRHVWLIVPNPALDQHPENNVAWWRESLADPAPLLPRLYFRIERQTTWPLPQFERAVFFIRLMMSPLLEVLRAAPGRAAELAASLRSMTPAVVAYRGMTDALPRLLSELDTLS